MKTWTNPHHLMLFYYVARYRGITTSLRHIGYSIQQPALSEQMLSLEAEIGAPLFARNPFKLTECGERLYRHVKPFFDPLPDLVDELRSGNLPCVRLGASELVLREYIPGLAATLRHAHPQLQFSFDSRPPAELFAALDAGQLDVAIAALSGPPPGLSLLPITTLPLVFLTPKTGPLGSLKVSDILQPGRVRHPLICPQTTDGVCQRFQDELDRRGIRWAPAIRTTSVALVTWYVAAGEGIGVSLDLPVLTRKPGIRVLRLPDFPPVQVSALTARSTNPYLPVVLGAISRRAAELWPRPDNSVES